MASKVDLLVNESPGGCKQNTESWNTSTTATGLSQPEVTIMFRVLAGIDGLSNVVD